jgi:hypothetical protein
VTVPTGKLSTAYPAVLLALLQAARLAVPRIYVQLASTEPHSLTIYARYAKYPVALSVTQQMSVRPASLDPLWLAIAALYVVSRDALFAMQQMSAARACSERLSLPIAALFALLVIAHCV